MQRVKSVLAALTNQRVRLIINIFGQPKGVSGVLIRYSKPFILLKTKQATRIINEHTVKEIIPTGEADLLELLQSVA